MNIIKKSSSLGFLSGMLLSLSTGNAAAALDIAQSPLSLADQVASNVMIMLDNSGSMTIRMYNGISFDGTNGKYSGIFDKDKTYKYDDSIVVKPEAYPKIKDASDTTMIDTDAKGAFVEFACTLPSANCWSGNFLNWLVARRIDASREVLIGGKLESRSPLDYGGGLKYKIVGNNEPSDRDYTVSASDSASYSPIPNDTSVTISSPAAGGEFKSLYDPYAKIRFSASSTGSPVLDSATNTIGEFGTTTVTESYKTIKFGKTYTDPIVVAAAPSYGDSKAVAVRIKGVTGTQFKIKLKRWKYDLAANPGATHGSETISYIVIEKGEHELKDGLKLKAGKTNTDKEYVDGSCGASRTANASVSFPSAFTSTPIVVSASMTENGGDPIHTRVWDINSSGFKVALQEEENQNGHAVETVGYIAIEAGSVDDAANYFKLEAGKISNVDDGTSPIPYTSSFTSAPALVAAMQTLNGSDTAGLRIDSNIQTAATVHVEEEQSCDSEVTHTFEDVGYVAIEDNRPSYNIALAVAEEPTGVLHEVKEDVRLGISFYRYDLDKNNIYEGVKTQGGTLRFKIPKNPFIKKPSETNTALLPTIQQGYRDPVLEGYIGTSIEDIVDAVEHYPMIWGTTPLAENLVEVIKYYEQKTPFYTDMATGFPDFELAKDDLSRPELDPFYIPSYSKRLHCVNNNVLIVTDGAPFRDANIDPAMENYDSDSKTGDKADSDINAANDVGKDNLDDVAYYAFCGEKGDTCKTGGKATVEDANGDLRTNLRDLRPDGTWTDLPGDQYLKIDTIGFAGNNVSQILKDTADNAAGTAYAASDGDKLRTAMIAAFKNAAQKTSASAISANSTRRSSDTLIYQASFDSGDWSGKLEAFELNADGSAKTTPKWTTDTAGTFAAHASRKVFTYKPPATAASLPGGSGIAFKTYADLAAAQKTALGANETEATARINYVRGDDTNEGTGLNFRARASILGDIANSNPWFVGRNNFGYANLSPEGSSYRTFLTNTRSRKDTVYVGANDGMLHAFDAATGVEKFAYVPAAVIPELSKLTDAEYGKSVPHQYFVDGSARANDVYINGAWKTVLVGTTGAGGKGLFLLDVTNPDTFGTSNVLFEYNAVNSAEDTSDDLGYTIPEPTIVRMANGKWSVVFGNGYGSASGKAVLYIADIEGVINGTSGSIIKIDTKVGSDNGLGSPLPVDINGDRIVDAIYAGDLKGNMWKFDVSNSNTNQWGSAFGNATTPLPMFTATDQATSTPQAITAKPQAGRHPDGGIMIYFGTGKFFEVGDNIVDASSQTQSFYGLRDNFANSASKPIPDYTLLVKQSIIHQSSEDFDSDGDGVDDVTDNVRITTDNDVEYNPVAPAVAKQGWYIDLKPPSGSGKGERVISQPFLNGSRVLFATMAPNENPCEFGGSGWLMLMDGVSGARPIASSFDFNNDTLFSTADYVTITIAGKQVTVVATGKQTGGGKMGGFTGDGSNLTIQVTGKDKDGKPKPDSEDIEDEANIGRQSWRQLR